MDYFSVIILIIAVFVFVTDRNIKDIEQIKKANTNIENQIYDIKQKLEIIEIDTQDMEYEKLFENNKINDIEKEYIFIKNKEIKLNDEIIDMLIANYIVCEKRVCGFNIQYCYKGKKWSLNRLYVDIINYLNIFNKQELNTYGAVICKKADVLEDEKKFKENIISYNVTPIISIELTEEQIKKDKLKRIYAQKLGDANLTIIIKILLLIISGSIITTNLIYSIFNANNNINSIITATVIYYCYSYLIRHIYRPIGRQKILASYIFPIYFIAYIVVGTSTLFTRRV